MDAGREDAWIPVRPPPGPQPHEGPPGPPPQAHPAQAGPPWPFPPPERRGDVFWGQAQPRMPRLTEAAFWGGGPRPHGRPSFLLWGAGGPWRMALVLAGMGGFGVFVQQAGPPLPVLIVTLLAGTVFPAVLLFLSPLAFAYGFLLQLVLGAPVFEEMAKFGVALLLVAPLSRGPRRGALAWLPAACLLGAGAVLVAHWAVGFPAVPALLLRMGLGATAGAALAGLCIAAPTLLVPAARLACALVVGAAFGVMEHHHSYAGEPPAGFALRIGFHSGATALTMLAYMLLEGMRDVRVRWFALAPSAFLHWLNNFTVIPVALLSLPLPGGDVVVFAWSGAITLGLYALMVLLPVLRGPVRRGAGRLAARHLPRAPPGAHEAR